MDRSHDGAAAMTVDHPESNRRQHVIAASMIVAMAILAASVAVVEIERWRNPRSRLFADRTFYSLAEAIQADDVEGAYAFLRAGANPNDVIEVRDPVLTRGRSVLASPLVWAVSTQRRGAVMMLLAHGARVESDADKAASCLADELGNADLAALLRKYGNTLPSDRCPALRDRTAPLLSLIGVTD
jgi:hypothetical protein